MTYVQPLLGEQGQANRRLGEEILKQMSLEASPAADQSRRNRTSTAEPVHGAAATWTSRYSRQGRPAANSAAITSRPQSNLRSPWISLEMAFQWYPASRKGRLSAPPE